MGFSARRGRRHCFALPSALALLPLAGSLLAGCTETGAGERLNVSQSPNTVSIASAPVGHAGMKFVQPAFEMRTVQAIAGQAGAEVSLLESSPEAESDGAERQRIGSRQIAALTAVSIGSSIDADDLIQSRTMPDFTMADRVVALQTQTMLAGLACGKVWADVAAFKRYADFTVRNSSLLRRSQLDVADRLGGVEAFDKMHTRISNGESKRLIELGDSAYCAEMRKPFYVVVDLDERRLADMAMDHETVLASLQ